MHVHVARYQYVNHTSKKCGSKVNRVSTSPSIKVRHVTAGREKSHHHQQHLDRHRPGSDLLRPLLRHPDPRTAPARPARPARLHAAASELLVSDTHRGHPVRGADKVLHHGHRPDQRTRRASRGRGRQVPDQHGRAADRELCRSADTDHVLGGGPDEGHPDPGTVLRVRPPGFLLRLQGLLLEEKRGVRGDLRRERGGLGRRYVQGHLKSATINQRHSRSFHISYFPFQHLNCLYLMMNKNKCVQC